MSMAGGVPINFYFTAPIASCLLLTASHAHSTVFEYGANEDTVITEKSQLAKDPIKPEKNASQPSDMTADQTIYRKLARDVATKYSGSNGVRAAGLDALAFVDVFEALIQRESDFNPLAVSPKGAAGLGQLMPGTASDLGVTDPFDPVTNLHGSAKYFTRQLEQFGSLDLALAAYNAGPKRVREYGGIPPFSETKAYIQWILAKAGLKPNKTILQQSLPSRNQSRNREAPLKGTVSVWEF